MNKVTLGATALLLLIAGNTYVKGSVYAKEEGDGYRFYSKDPLYPITTWVSVQNAVDEDGNPFANLAALKTWVEDNVNVEPLQIPAPPAEGAFVLESNDGVVAWVVKD